MATRTLQKLGGFFVYPLKLLNISIWERERESRDLQLSSHVTLRKISSQFWISITTYKIRKTIRLPIINFSSVFLIKTSVLLRHIHSITINHVAISELSKSGHILFCLRCRAFNKVNIWRINIELKILHHIKKKI